MDNKDRLLDQDNSDILMRKGSRYSYIHVNLTLDEKDYM